MAVIPEKDVLVPVDPKLHPDDWPIHHLKKVNVISQQTQQCVSLLESHKDHAVQVTGILQMKGPSSGQKKASDVKWRSKRVEINNVSFWAFSEDSDSTVSLWASGTAGWFELHDPVPQYQDMFDRMNEAVSMLYHLADKYRRSWKNNSCLNLKDLDRHVRSVFRDYYTSGRGRSSESDPEVAVSRFHSHARFLITSMLEGQDDQDWHRSPFLRYYKRHFPEIYDEVDTRLHPGRQSKQAKVNSNPTQATTYKKQVPMVPPIRKSNSQVSGQRPGRQTRSNAPRTPAQTSRQGRMDDTSDDESYDSNGKVIEAGTKRKSKSILQPKGSKFSKKAAGRRQGLPPTTDGADEASPGSDDKIEPPEISPLAAMALRETPYQPQLPRKVAEVKMVSYDIPTEQPQGPGDLWNCTFENCNHRVHEGSKPKGKSQIKDHFQEHARKAQEKIDLALSESRPYLPVR
ncbi:MAG: hypothetical protein Q9201_000134 [Fulgogasparrea decipioides]